MARDEYQFWLDEINRQIAEQRRMDRWLNVWIAIAVGALVGVLTWAGCVEWSGGW